MSRKKYISKIEIHATPNEFPRARFFIEEEMLHQNISKTIITETVLVFEALFNNILNQGFPDTTLIKISSRKSFGNVTFKLGFDGKMFIPKRIFDDPFDPEIKIIQVYDDKLDYIYKESYNVITLSVHRGFQKPFLYSMFSIALAILIYAFLHFFLNDEVRQLLLTDYIYPIENLFSRAVLMIGAPVTFFSFVKNLADTYIISERSSITRKLQSKTISTSIVAILLAIGTGYIGAKILSFGIDNFFINKDFFSSIQSFAEILDEIMPSNIFEPFMVVSPLPVIIIGLLFTYAMCKTGKYFQPIKNAVDTCYTLFSKTLTAIMYVLPFFCFIAFLDMLIKNGYAVLIQVLFVSVFTVCGLMLVMLFYLIRLKIAGVHLKSFLKKIPRLIHENFMINSVIDATPFNTRYCAKNFGMNRKRLEESLPTLAQINLDGNCFILMLSAILIAFFTHTTVSLWNGIIVSLLVLFLSLGAPNQPGSILIGILIIISYLNIPNYIAVAIYMEVFLGNLQNITNFLGDVTIVAIEEKKAGIPL